MSPRGPTSMSASGIYYTRGTWACFNSISNICQPNNYYRYDATSGFAGGDPRQYVGSVQPFSSLLSSFLRFCFEEHFILLRVSNH